MIGKLTGTLLEKNPPEVVVDCAGVGYEVQVPMARSTTCRRLASASAC